MKQATPFPFDKTPSFVITREKLLSDLQLYFKSLISFFAFFNTLLTYGVLNSVNLNLSAPAALSHCFLYS